MIREAEISPDGVHRYTLTRHWGEAGSANVMAFCGLNPSKADAAVDDPTARRFAGFAKREGCDGFVAGNLYGFRATDPDELWKAADPIGPDNDEALRDLAARYPIIVLCWGATVPPLHSRGRHRRRIRDVLEIFEQGMSKPMCLGFSAAGDPRHPLYLPSDAPLVVYQ